MSNRSRTPSYSESELTNTTPDDLQSSIDEKNELSKAAISELIEKQIKPLWKALGDTMKDRAEIKLRTDDLESSENNLKNQVENFTLNNEQLVDLVEKMGLDNEELKKMLNEMELSGQIRRLQEQHESEREGWKREKNELKEKIEALELAFIEKKIQDEKWKDNVVKALFWVLHQPTLMRFLTERSYYGTCVLIQH